MTLERNGEFPTGPIMNQPEFSSCEFHELRHLLGTVSSGAPRIGARKSMGTPSGLKCFLSWCCRVSVADCCEPEAHSVQARMCLHWWIITVSRRDLLDWDKHNRVLFPGLHDVLHEPTPVHVKSFDRHISLFLSDLGREIPDKVYALLLLKLMQPDRRLTIATGQGD